MGLSFGTRGKKKKGTGKSNKTSATAKQNNSEEYVEPDEDEHSENSLSSGTRGKKKKETAKSKKKSTATKETISEEYIEPKEDDRSDSSEWSEYNRVGV